MAEANTPTREYETIYVLKPELDDAKIVEIEERLREVVLQGGGKSIKIHNWGKKKLSFEKEKVQKGIYVHHLYLGTPTVVSEYERVLKFLDDALLYQTIKLADAADPETRPEEPDVLHLPVRDGGRRDRDQEDRHTKPDDNSAEAEAKPEAKPDDNSAEAEAKPEAKPAEDEAKPAEAEASPAAETETPEKPAAEASTPEAAPVEEDK